MTRSAIFSTSINAYPIPEQESEEIGDEIIARLNPDNGNIENLEILFFSKRLQTQNIFELPIVAPLQLAS